MRWETLVGTFWVNSEVFPGKSVGMGMHFTPGSLSLCNIHYTFQTFPNNIP